MRKIQQLTLPLCLAIGAWAALAVPAQADTTLRYESGKNDFVMKVRDGEIRIDDGSKRWQLYRQSEGAIYSVEPRAKRYSRMDAAAAAAIKSEMNKLRERMDEQLAQLPESQRAAARAALANQIPGMTGEAQKIELEHSGRSDKAGGVACEPVQVIRDGKPGERLCVASAEAMDMPEGEFKTVISMFALMETMLSGTGLEYIGLPYLNFDGIPVRYAQPDGGARSLSAVSKDDLPDSVFQIPDSYNERAVGLGR